MMQLGLQSLFFIVRLLLLLLPLLLLLLLLVPLCLRVEMHNELIPLLQLPGPLLGRTGVLSQGELRGCLEKFGGITGSWSETVSRVATEEVVVVTPQRRRQLLRLLLLLWCWFSQADR